MMIAFATVMAGHKRLAVLSSRAVGPAFHLLSRVYTHFAERHALKRLARQSPHLMRDMGFDPEEVMAAANGETPASEPFRLRLARKRAEAGTGAVPAPERPATTPREMPKPAAPRLDTAGSECR